MSLRSNCSSLCFRCCSAGSLSRNTTPSQNTPSSAGCFSLPHWFPASTPGASKLQSSKSELPRLLLQAPLGRRGGVHFPSQFYYRVPALARTFSAPLTETGAASGGSLVDPKAIPGLAPNQVPFSFITTRGALLAFADLDQVRKEN